VNLLRELNVSTGRVLLYGSGLMFATARESRRIANNC
jgi:hypothetical protein